MNEKDKIEWSKEYHLQWSDYLAEQNPAQYHPAKTSVQYSATWKVNWNENNRQLSYSINNIELVTEFHKNISWVRQQEIQDDLQKKLILNHEQGHFDLAEKLRPRITEQIQKSFSDKIFPVFGKDEEHAKDFVLKDSKERVQMELEKQTVEIYKKEDKKYDEHTEYGSNQEKQKEFDNEFLKLKES